MGLEKKVFELGCTVHAAPSILKIPIRVLVVRFRRIHITLISSFCPYSLDACIWIATGINLCTERHRTSVRARLDESFNKIK